MLEGDPLEVAPRLLGAIVHSRGVSVRLTEVEAYRGVGVDPGSHAFRGPTTRTKPMFGAAGSIYVYLTYGMHLCVNLVCGPTGIAGAVLLRAGEVVDGIELATERRAAGALRRQGACASRVIAPRDLARGPARLASALGIELTDTGGMLDSGALALNLGAPPPLEIIAAGPRVGVSGPGGGVEFPWRFWLAGEPSVSVYRPAVTRAR